MHKLYWRTYSIRPFFLLMFLYLLMISHLQNMALLQMVPQLDQRQCERSHCCCFWLFRPLNLGCLGQSLTDIRVLFKVGTGGCHHIAEEVPNKVADEVGLSGGTGRSGHRLKAADQLKVVAAGVADAVLSLRRQLASLQGVNVGGQAVLTGAQVSIHATAHQQ